MEKGCIMPVLSFGIGAIIGAAVFGACSGESRLCLREGLGETQWDGGSAVGVQVDSGGRSIPCSRLGTEEL